MRHKYFLTFAIGLIVGLGFFVPDVAMAAVPTEVVDFAASESMADFPDVAVTWKTPVEYQASDGAGLTYSLYYREEGEEEWLAVFENGNWGAPGDFSKYGANLYGYDFNDYRGTTLATSTGYEFRIFATNAEGGGLATTTAFTTLSGVMDIYDCDDLLETDGSRGIFHLRNDINVSECSLNMDDFFGTFYGHDNTLSGLSQPLYGSMENATVSDLNFSDAHFNDDYGGTLAYSIIYSNVTNIRITDSSFMGGGALTTIAESSHFTNIDVTDSVTIDAGDWYTGGIVGSMGLDSADEDLVNGSSLTYSTSSAVVVCADCPSVGGIVGQLRDTNLSHVYSNSTIYISDEASCGGIVGEWWPQEDVARDFTDWTFAGAIKASEGETPVAYSIGGLIGTMWPSGENNIISSTVTGQVTPDYSAAEVVGGLVGVVLDDDNGETNIVNNTVLSDHPMMGNVVGGLVGELEVDDNVNILNNRVVSSQTLGGTWLAGGLIGYIWNDATDEEIMLVDNNYASTTVSVDMSNGETNSAAGGLIGGAVYYSSGEISRLTIVNSFSAGTVSTPDYFAGGLVGAINTGIYGDVTDAEGSFIIRNSSSTADIIGGDGEHISVGGLLGGTYDVDYDDPIIPVPSGNIGGVTIHQSYATGNVTSESQSETSYAGGLVGSMICDGVDAACAITESYATGDVAGGYNVGGILGYGENLTDDEAATIEIHDSYATGTVSGLNRIGGIIGTGVRADLKNVYSLGANESTNESAEALNVGGLAGTLTGSLSNSFAAGRVTSVIASSDGTVNAFVGSSTAILSNNYFDSTASGQSLCFPGWVSGENNAECIDQPGSAASGYFYGDETVPPYTAEETQVWDAETWGFPSADYPKLLAFWTAPVEDPEDPEPEPEEPEVEELSRSRSSSSGGCSVVCRVNNLLAQGNNAEAETLKHQYPQIFPQASASSSPATDIASLEARILELRSQIALLLATSVRPSFTRSLSLGLTGSDVRALQVFLNTHGYTVASTGAGSTGQETDRFGTLTHRAVIRFQQAYNIDPIGIVGPKTQARIRAILGVE